MSARIVSEAFPSSRKHGASAKGLISTDEEAGEHSALDDSVLSFLDVPISRYTLY